MAKQQFNVSLDPELVRRVKHRAIDAQMSLSDLVTAVFTDHFDRPGTTMTDEQRRPAATDDTTRPAAANDGPDPTGGLRLQPMVHVADLGASVRFYEQLGGTLVHGSRDGDWALLSLGGAEIGLLAHPPNPEQGEDTVELNFQSTTSLERLEAGLRQAGVPIVRPTSDEGFGRQLQVSTPDGMLVKINELEPELYT